MNLEFIKFIKETVYHCFKTDLGTKYKYLIKDILPLNYNLMVVHCYDFKYLTEQITELKYPGKYTHELKLLLDTTAELILEHKETRLIIKKRKHFSLDVYCTFNPETEYFSFSLLDKNQVVLNQYFDLVYESYKDLKIGSLVDNDYKINDESAVAFFTKVTRINKSIKNDFFLFYNLGRITQDTRFLVTNMLLLNPYITDFLSDKFVQNGKTYYRYFPTICDKQYLLSAGILFELFYNYWDQVGDILAKVFLPDLPEKEIYFGKVIDTFPSTYFASKNYIWLQDFKTNHYGPLNSKRKRIVHYNSIESDYFEKYQDLFGDTLELEKLQKEKEELADYFLKHHDFALKGFEYMTNLISEK